MDEICCPLCDRPVHPALLAWADRLAPAVGAALTAAHPGWTVEQGVCPACVLEMFDALRLGDGAGPGGGRWPRDGVGSLDLAAAGGADGAAGGSAVAVATAPLPATFMGPLINDHLVRFLYREPAQAVALTADFNGWQPAAQPLDYLGTGLWACSVPDLAPGRYRYKFLVDGLYWEADPQNPHQEPDGYDGVCSVILVN